MQGHLQEVFSHRLNLGVVFEGKELLKNILQASEGRNRRSHDEQYPRPAEADAVASLTYIERVLRQCGGEASSATGEFETARLECNAGADEVLVLLHEAQGLITVAREGSTSVQESDLDASAFEKLTLLRALLDFEQKLRLCSPFQYKNGTILMVTKGGWSEQQDKLIKRQSRLKSLDAKTSKEMGDSGSRLRDIAALRAWLFHHEEPKIKDPAVLLHTMGYVLGDLAGLKDHALLASLLAAEKANLAADWEWVKLWVWHKPLPSGLIRILLSLKLSESRMSIPYPEERILVGRDDAVKEAADAIIAGDYSRVLIHGLPGVGKDVVAVKVVCSEDVRLCAGLELQDWLQASTDDMLRRQLVAFFEAQRPEILQGVENDQPAALQRIKRYLTEHNDWFFVIEDATWETRALWDCFPSDGTGRLLITSQVSLHKEEGDNGAKLLHVTSPIELGPISTEQSKQVLLQMSIFPVVDDDPATLESELETRCKNTESSWETIEFKPPPLGEKPKDAKKRRKSMRTQLLAHEQLSLPEMDSFLSEILGNLPLSVQFNGHLLRSDPGLNSIPDLIAQFKDMSLVKLDRDGKNPLCDTHYIGLDSSVHIAVARMEAHPDASAAKSLLAALAVLPRAATPRSLFQGNQVEELLGSDGGNVEFLRVFDGGEALDKAEKLLCQYGLLNQGGADDGMIGAIHQLVQQTVRERWLPASETQSGEQQAESVAEAVRRLLLTRFKCDDFRDPANWPMLNELAPCVDQWLNLMERGSGQLGKVKGSVSVEGRLCGHRAIYYGMLGQHKKALTLQLEVVAFMERVLPKDHPDTASAKSNLASTYDELGRHEEALTLKLEVVAFRERVLPKDHLDTAKAKDNLA